MNSLSQISEQIAVERQRERRRMRVLLLLGCAVALAVGLALMVPALSMTAEPTCGLEEHVHTEECYADGELACGLEEHVHTEECYAPAGGEEPAEAEEAPAEEPAALPIEQPEAPADEADPLPAQSFMHELRDEDGAVVLTVSVDAPQGALPAGTTMEVRPVADADVAEAVDAAVGAGTDEYVAAIQAVDITFRDAQGAEVEPLVPVTVRMASSLVAETDDLMIVHVPDEGEGAAEVVEALDGRTLEQRNLVLAEDELAFDAAAFSTYSIVVTQDSIDVNAAVGETVEIAATGLQGKVQGNFGWTSSDASVATVTGSTKFATITAHQIGSTTVTLTYKYGKKENKLDTEGTVKYVVTVTAVGEDPARDDYEAQPANKSDFTVSVKDTGQAKKLSGYHVVVKTESTGGFDVGDATALAAYHIYLADGDDKEVSASELGNGTLNLQVTLTYNELPDWFASDLDVKHFKNGDEQAIQSVEFNSTAKQVRFKVHGFSDFVFVKNADSSSLSGGSGGSSKGDPYLVSKTAAATDVENEYEITLTVNPSITWPKKSEVHYQGLDEIFEASGVWLINSNNNVNEGVYSKDSSITDATNYTQIKSAAGISGQANGGRIMTPSEAAKATSSNPNKEFKITKITIDGTTITLSKPYYVWLTTNSNITCLWVLPNGNYLKLSASVNGKGDCTLTFGGNNVGKLIQEYAAEYVYLDDVGNFSNATIATPTNVNDPMGSYASFLNFTGIDGTSASGSSANSSYSSASGAASKVTWTFSKALPTSGATYKQQNGMYYLTSKAYELKYKVRLDVQKDAFKSTNPNGGTQTWYATNGTTTLNYSGGSQNFPIPQVVGILYDVQVKKVDADGNPLAGAEFSLSGSGNNGAIAYGTEPGQTKQTATSDANGYATFAGLPWGDYAITESKAPNGYAKSSGAISVSLGYVRDGQAGYTTSTANGTHLMKAGISGANVTTVSNEKNVVTVEKVVDANDNLMADVDQTVYFVLQNREGTGEYLRDADGNVMCRAITIADGVPGGIATFGEAATELVPSGKYDVWELSAPPQAGATDEQVTQLRMSAGYQFGASGRKVQVARISAESYEGDAWVNGNNADLSEANTARVKITNSYSKVTDTISFEVYKAWVDATGQVIESPSGLTATLVLTRASGAEGADRVVDGTFSRQITLPVSGDDPWKAVFKDLPINDENGNQYEYRVHEISASSGWRAYSSQESTTPMADGDYLNVNGGTIWNKQDASIVVKKTDGTAFLPGATFELYRVAGSDVLVGDAFTVDSDAGVTITGLAPGAYKLRETVPPNGYVIMDSPIEFTVGASNSGSVVTWAGDGSQPANAQALTTTVFADDTITVINAPGAALPQTGGSGTFPYTLGGAALVAGALMCGLRARRRERRLVGGL